LRRLLFAPLIALAAVALADEPPAQPPRLYTPADMIVFAARDLPTIPPEARPYTHWLALWNVRTLEARNRYAAVLAGHVAGLNRDPEWQPPLIVPNTDTTLLRIDIRDYGWTRELFELLKDSDPFFHVRIQRESVAEEKIDPSPDDEPEGKTFDIEGKRFEKRNGIWFDPDGKRYRLEKLGSKDAYGRDQTVMRSIKNVPKRAKRIVALSPILSETKEQRDALTALVDGTQSSVPVVGGLWFLQQTAIQFGRTPGYYDFLGVKDRDGFEKLIGFNAKLNEESRRVALLEAVAVSGVAQQPRRIQIDNTIGDTRYYRTFDNDKAVDEANPLRVFDDKNFKHKAEEAIGSKPDGWLAWGLFQADGTRQDSAPDFIGGDRTSKSNDLRIHVNLACWRCHTAEQLGGKAGLQDIRQWVRGHPPTLPPLGLQSPDYALRKQFAQEYGRPIIPVLERDRLTVAEKVKSVTGLDAAKFGVAYGDAFFVAAEQPVGIAEAEADLGVDRAMVLKAWGTTLRLYQALDPVLVNLVRETGANPQVLQALSLPGTPGVGRPQWEEAFFLAEAALRGIAPVEAVKVRGVDCWIATFKNPKEKRP
jgi:hypothetical protein